MASVKIDARNVIKALGNIQKGLEDMSPFFKNLGDLEVMNARLNFKNQKGPNGEPWEDSKTIRRDKGSKARAAGRAKIKKRMEADYQRKVSGNEVAAVEREMAWNYVLKSRFHAVPPGWHWFDRTRGDKVLTDTGTLRNSIGRDFGKDFAIVGTNLEYAEKHQEGIGVAKRPFLGVNNKTNKNIQTALKAYLKGLL